MKICADIGHRNNTYDFGATGNGQKESVLALAIGKKLKAELEQVGVTCLLTRSDESTTISLNDRTKFAVENNCDLFVSIHMNSANNTAAQGIEVWYKSMGDLAESVCSAIVCNTEGVNRGAKQTDNLYVLNYFKNSILIECGFISNAKEASLLSSEEYQDKIVKGIVQGISSYYNLQEVQCTDVTGEPTASIEQMKAWARSKGATEYFINNASIYYSRCTKIGVNPIAPYAQYGKESGYGAHKGIVPASYHNPCGLKTKAGGSDTDVNAHSKFDTWEHGIAAHVDHFALYLGVNGYPKQYTYDARHFDYLFGTGKTLEALCKVWCPSDTNYAMDLKKLMKEIEASKDAELESALYRIKTKGAAISANAWIKISIMKLEYCESLITKIGEALFKTNNYTSTIDYLVNKKAITNREVWDNKQFKASNVRTLIINISNL